MQCFMKMQICVFFLFFFLWSNLGLEQGPECAICQQGNLWVEYDNFNSLEIKVREQQLFI